MSKANKTLSGYGSLAKAMGFLIKNDKFYMMGETPDDLIPAKRKGRQLVLPTYERITEGFGEKLHPFHPMCESVLEGQSETVKWLRDAVRYSIQLHVTTLVTEVLNVACGTRKPRSPKFHKMMAKVTEGATKPKFDQILLDDWNKFIVESAKDDDIHRWINIFLNSNQVIDGTKYLRALNFTSIFVDEGNDGTSEIFGIKMTRKVNKTIIINLINHVLDFVPETVGSNDDRPWLGCILRAYCAFVMNYNKTIRTFKEVHPVTVLDDEWFDMIENMKDYSNAIQALELNTGDEREVRSVAKEQPVAPLPKADAPSPHHKPYTATEIEEPKEPQGRSILDVNGASATGLTQHQATQWMSPAKQRELERQGNNGSMFGTAQQQSYFDEPTPTSMFGNQNSSGGMFSAPQQTPGMFDKPSNGGLFGGNGGGDMPTFGGQRTGSHFG